MKINRLAIRPRVTFDPTNQEHLREYAIYLEQGRWPGNCRFELEYPYLEIPAMINAKLARHMLSKYMGIQNDTRQLQGN